MATRKGGRKASLPKHAQDRWSAEVSKRLQVLMKESGLSQNAFARRCGVSAGAMHNWLSGKALPRVDQIRGVREAFGVTMDWLLGDDLAPKFTRDWQTTEATFAEMLAREATRDMPADARPILDEWGVYVTHILADVRERVVQEARELQRRLGAKDSEEMLRLRELRKLAGQLHDHAQNARGKTAGAVLTAGIKLRMIALDLLSEASFRQMRDATGVFQQLRYLRPAGDSLVWSDEDEQAAGVGVAREFKLRGRNAR